MGIAGGIGSKDFPIGVPILEQTWRWFGPADKVTLPDARQAGAHGIVTALSEVPAGAPWPVEAIRERQALIARSGLRWSVAESLEVTDAIKLRGPHWQRDIDAFMQSLRNLAACGIRTIAYNLMPVFSWTRTHLHRPLPHGGFATQFDAIAFAAFDLFLLKRKDSEADWSQSQRRLAERYLHSLAPAQRDELLATILEGLPGGNAAYTLDALRTRLDAYRELDHAAMRENAAAFLRAVCPLAQELGVRLCIHPDDPPRRLLGLPRIVSTEGDLDFLLSSSPEESNAITFCTGALGVRPDNRLVTMAERFAPRIGFAHLRSTQRVPAEDAVPESFFEAEHLAGDADLLHVVAALVQEERRRAAAGIDQPIPFRADHGQELLDDRQRGAYPGYPAIGRLRGLAELRGVILATERWLPTTVESPAKIFHVAR